MPLGRIANGKGEKNDFFQRFFSSSIYNTRIAGDFFVGFTKKPKKSFSPSSGGIQCHWMMRKEKTNATIATPTT